MNSGIPHNVGAAFDAEVVAYTGDAADQAYRDRLPDSIG